MASQETFLNCYRGNQSAIRHAAYMRMSKVLLLRELLRDLHFQLDGKSIFDYGFGAGTFFRYCPKSSGIFGVELDAVTVEEVASMLRQKGFENVRLDGIQIDDWSAHPLLRRTYDLIICSHVLEHLTEPGAFLERLGQCIRHDGYLLGLVPINERKQDPHHVRIVNQEALAGWLEGTGLELATWKETDAWLYWIQPMFTHESGFYHTAAQSISLGLGAAAMVFGHRRWFQLSSVFQWVSRSRPTQAAFVIRRKE